MASHTRRLGFYKLKNSVIESQLSDVRSGFGDPLRGKWLSVLGPGGLQLKVIIRT